ncbi:hypothetical protein ACIBAC_00090 [Streptomyces sp. NPDC051362]|uniref:hypothetical protein n=1 Tax=Streptomyces sp. NPDC051362 TaxID=3365651 RepID=UPI00378747C1
MTEQRPGHPVTVEIRTPLPTPIGPLARLISLVQDLADELGGGTLLMGQHVRTEGTDYVLSFTGHAQTEHEDDAFDDDGDSIHSAGSKDPLR